MNVKCPGWRSLSLTWFPCSFCKTYILCSAQFCTCCGLKNANYNEKLFLGVLFISNMSREEHCLEIHSDLIDTLGRGFHAWQFYPLCGEPQVKGH